MLGHMADVHMNVWKQRIRNAHAEMNTHHLLPDISGGIKQVASYQVGFLTDATASLGKGLKKSIKGYRNEAKNFARSLNECIDVEDARKSLHLVTHPVLCSEDHDSRKTSIVHTPIDWSKYPPSAFRNFSQEPSMTITEESEDDVDEEESNEENEGISQTPSKAEQLLEAAHNRHADNFTDNIDSVDGKHSAANRTHRYGQRSSLDQLQTLKITTPESKNRTKSVSSYPFDKPKHQRPGENSLSVKNSRTSRDRVPSPRPITRKFGIQTKSSDRHEHPTDGYIPSQ